MFKKIKIVIFSLLVIYIFMWFRNDSLNISLLGYYNTSNPMITMDNYYMLLEIPKINVKRKIFEIGSNENNINKNVMLLYEGYTIIIVAHSGSNDNAYFKNLRQLAISDEVILHTENMTKNYKVSNIFYHNKNMEFSLKKEYENKLLLITCLNKDKYLIVECTLNMI